MEPVPDKGGIGEALQDSGFIGGAHIGTEDTDRLRIPASDDEMIQEQFKDVFPMAATNKDHSVPLIGENGHIILSATVLGLIQIHPGHMGQVLIDESFCDHSIQSAVDHICGYLEVSGYRRFGFRPEAIHN